jgi:Putative neutral zinc metallopeptidase
VKIRWAVFLTWLVLIITAACANQDGARSTDMHETSPTMLGASLYEMPVSADLTDQQLGTECPVGEQVNGGGICEPCADLEGCYTKSAQMSYFFSQIVAMVQEYSAVTYRAMPDVDEWRFVQRGESGPEGCTDRDGRRASFNDQSYEYCPLDRTVYVGEMAMWDFYSRLGDAAPAVGIAHEWGHHLQTMVGMTSDNTLTDAINSENQADCVAGSWSAWLVGGGIMVEDDFGDVGSLLVEIASTEGPERDHGTVDEREKSFIDGFKGGLSACNDYAPDTPLLR